VYTRSGVIGALALARVPCGCSPSPAVVSFPLPPVSDIVKACAIEVSCLISPPLESVSRCVSAFEFGIGNGAGVWGHSAAQLAQYVDCAKGAMDCQAALSCASRSHDPTYCATHPGNSCDGNLEVECNTPPQTADWAIYNLDCGALGLMCEVVNGSAGCTNGVPCKDNGPPQVCDGNRIVECPKGLAMSEPIDCGYVLTSSTCVPETNHQTPVAACLPPGAMVGSCGSDSSWCDGNNVVNCWAGVATQFDCSQAGETCGLVGAAGACLPKEDGCEAAGDSCQGDALTVCANGSLVSFPCSSIGLNTCAKMTMGAVCR
jgi:hypothetical protein